MYEDDLQNEQNAPDTQPDWMKTGGVTGQGSSATSQPSAMPVSPYNREQFRDQWMSTGTDTNRQNALLQQYGLSADASGRVALPTDVNGHAAETLDLRIGAKAGNNQAGWTDIGMNGSSNGSAAGGSGSGAGAAGSGGGGYQDAVRAALMAQLERMGKPIDPNDPIIATQLNAQSNLLERERQQRRAASAERMAANGLNSGGAGSGAFEQDLAAGFEDKAGQLGGLQGQLLARANEQRISQLQQALSLAVQSGDAESARAIQLQIAQMQNALGQASLSQQGSQFNDNFGLNAAQFQYQKDRDLLNYGTGA